MPRHDTNFLYISGVLKDHQMAISVAVTQAVQVVRDIQSIPNFATQTGLVLNKSATSIIDLG